jgi:hypothetical protein
MAKNLPAKRSNSRLSLMLHERSGSTNDVADWGTITPKVLVDLVQTVARLSGAVRLGYTRDGGAYSVGIYLDDDRETFYCKPSDDLDRFVSELTELLQTVG